ncbi:MAG TPA: hypothetical protein VGK73_40480, partial [Polyangiaceae bacterium]
MSVRSVGPSLPTNVFAAVGVVALGVAGLLYWKGPGVSPANAASAELRALRAELEAVRESAERPRVVREIRTEPIAAAAEPA